MNLFDRDLLRSKMLAGIISESTYNKMIKEGERLKDLSFEFENSISDIGVLNESVSINEEEVSDDNIIKTLDVALKSITDKLEPTLASVLKKSGNKDGVADISEDEDYIKELSFNEEVYRENLSEGGLVGLTLSAPAIIQLGGKMAGWIGKKLDQEWLQKYGGKVADAGDKLHHKYIQGFEAVIKKFMPNSSDEEVHKAAEALMMGVVGILFAAGITHPGALEAVKGQELAGYVRKVLPSVMDKIGIV